MIVIHDPEQLAACHQTWVTDVEIHLPGVDKVFVISLEEGGLEIPLTAGTYYRLTRQAIEKAREVITHLQSEGKV